MLNVRKNRREILTGIYGLSVGYGLLSTGLSAAAAREIYLLSGFTPGNIFYGPGKKPEAGVDVSREYLRISSLATAGKDQVVLRDRVHSVVPSPVDPDLMLIITKPGTESYLLHRGRNDLIIRIKANEGHIFSGHGVFSPDGRQVYIGEVKDKRGEGVVSIRDSSTGEQIGKLPGHGMDPHEMLMLDNGNTLVQANTLDSGSALCFIDTKTGKLTETFYSPVPGQLVRHFIFLNNEDFVIGCKLDDRVSPGKDDTAMLLFGRRGQKEAKILSMRDITTHSNDASWQFLSLAWNAHNNIVGATSDTNNCVAFADATSGQLRGSLTVEMPTGIVYSQSADRFLINTQTGYLHEVEPTSLQITKTIAAGMTGPHLFELPLTKI